jgi:hypothetical protein
MALIEHIFILDLSACMNQLVSQPDMAARVFPPKYHFVVELLGAWMRVEREEVSTYELTQNSPQTFASCCEHRMQWSTCFKSVEPGI